MLLEPILFHTPSVYTMLSDRTGIITLGGQFTAPAFIILHEFNL